MDLDTLPTPQQCKVENFGPRLHQDFE